MGSENSPHHLLHSLDLQEKKKTVHCMDRNIILHQ
jgi:hypothetical protein